MKEKWLVTYSMHRNGNSIQSSYKMTEIYEGTLEEFIAKNESRDENDVRQYYVIIHFAIKL